MKKALQTLLLLLVAVLILGPNAHAASGESHWYCIRTKAHRQPPIPPELSFVTDYDAYYIDRTHGDGCKDKVLYFTFDAGYENGNVEKTLDILHQYNVPAAFFVLSHLVTDNAALLIRMKNEGHLVCNHTANHPNLAHASPEKIHAEIAALEDTYKLQTGETLSPYFRPPEGSFSREMLSCVKDLGYKTVFWSFAYADWDNQKQPDPAKALRTVMDNMHNGAVILLHPTSSTNVQILPQVIEGLRAEGYRFGTLDELCANS